MLAKRIIPTVLCRGRTLVKGERFNGWRSVGLAMQAAQIHSMRGVDEIALLDIGATQESRGPDVTLVRELSTNCFTPLSVGGGVRTLQHVEDLLREGADKVVIGSALHEVQSLLSAAAYRFGRQAIVASIDYRRHAQAFTVVYGRNGTRVANATSALATAKQVENEGAGEILLSCIDLDGTMEGYDLHTLKQVTAAVSIPVVACGGCSGYEDMLQAIHAGADAVSAGALFQFTDATPAGAAAYLQAHGVEVRKC